MKFLRATMTLISSKKITVFKMRDENWKNQSTNLSSFLSFLWLFVRLGREMVAGGDGGDWEYINNWWCSPIKEVEYDGWDDKNGNISSNKQQLSFSSVSSSDSFFWIVVGNKPIMWKSKFINLSSIYHFINSFVNSYSQW